jgi:hypothetical protein
LGAAERPERGIGSFVETESPVGNRGEPILAQAPGYAGVSAFRLFKAVWVAGQTGTVYLKQGADHERSSALQYSDFLQRVEGQIATNRSVSDARRESEDAVTVTLETLNERITRGEARDLAAQLPEEIQPALRPKAEEA